MRALFVPAIVLLLLPSCDRARGDAREWTPADHDQPAGRETPGQTTGKTPSEGGPNLVEIAWAKNCVPCHGARGRGDGPQGAMMRAPDLTRGDWQDRVDDREIAEVIQRGKNKMPAFDLPPAVQAGLVKKIRQLRGK